MPEPALKTESDSERPQVMDVQQSRTEAVHADLVRMHQSAASEVTADGVELHMSAAANLRASMVEAHEAALGVVNANEVWMTNSASAAIQAERVDVDGGAVVVLAQTVNFQNANAGLVAGRQVRAAQIKTLVFLGGHVEGEVHSALDTRQTLLAGLVGGLVMGTVYLFARTLLRRR